MLGIRHGHEVDNYIGFVKLLSIKVKMIVILLTMLTQMKALAISSSTILLATTTVATMGTMPFATDTIRQKGRMI